MTLAGLLQILIIPAALGGWLTVDEIRRTSIAVWPRPIALQLAWSRANADAILKVWKKQVWKTSLRHSGEPAVRRVSRSIRWDFGFIPSYAVFFAGLVSLPWAGPEWLAILQRYGLYAPLAAGALDVVENLGMLAMVDHHRMNAWLPRLVTVCSVGKFALIAATAVAIVVALATSVVTHL